MIPLWFSLVSLLLIAYIIFDGRNFGVGMLHGLVAKTPQERRQVIEAVGPMFSWHEVWLISFGGTMLAIFPRVLAVSFAGYYLALFLILWCYILRGMALEVGGHIADRLWNQFWDFVFVFSSTLLAVLFGAAAGNVARGAPVDENGNFSMAFFTNFNVGKNVGLLDWYTVSIGAFAVVILAAHGAVYLTMKTDGPVHDRSAAYARKLWLATIPLLLIITVETWYVRPEHFEHGLSSPICWMGIVAVVGAVVAIATGIRSGNELRAFYGSNVLIAAMLATGAATIYPYMLLSTIDPRDSLSAFEVASSPGTLLSATFWWPVAFFLTLFYWVVVARRYKGKVSARAETPGHHGPGK